jgi:hypothetical protein
MYRSLHRRQHRRQAAIDTSKGGSDRRAREFDVPTGTARPLLTVVTVIVTVIVTIFTTTFVAVATAVTVAVTVVAVTVTITVIAAIVAAIAAGVAECGRAAESCGRL